MMKLGLVALVLIGCATAASVADAKDAKEAKLSWRVNLITSGGLTGRGLGQVLVSDDASVAFTPPGSFPRGCRDPEAAKKVEAAIKKAKPKAWQQTYGQGGGDQILYKINLILEPRGLYTASWYDSNVKDIPKDLKELYDVVWSLRGACQKPKK